jgi:hypothetical protein
MAFGEVTGASPSEVERLEGQYYNTPLYLDNNIPFEVSYCLTEIGKQPDEYDGPQRYCKKRVAKRDASEYDGGKFDKAAYAPSCRFHGGDNAKGCEKTKHNLENPLTAGLTHGTYAEDEHLIMDFTDSEQILFDRIMNDWPEVYDWPSRSDDPARYRILRRVAVNEVRAMRQEDYLDAEGETVEIPVFDDEGNQTDTKDEENPVSREYRLLMKEVTNQMKQLALTPKERQKMDSLESQADKDDAISEIANDALHGGDKEYDPEQFEEDG